MKSLDHKFIFFITVFLAITYSGINAQTGRQIDPLRLKKIVYPPLTEREGIHLTIPEPPAEHPRLFFRKSYLSAIKMKADHPLLKDSWEKVNQSANFVTDGKLVQGVIHNVNMRIVNAIEAKAFMYAFTGDQKMGNEAVDLLFNLNNTLIINPEKPDVCRDIGRVILTTAIVYDWCYDLITSTEKKNLIEIMESLAVDMEVKWPQLVQNSISGHGVEAQVARDMLSCGIATYNEKPDIYRRVAGRIFAEFIPAQNFWYLSGYHHQGSSYGPYRYSWEIYTMLIFDRMGYSNLTNSLQDKIPYRWLYTRRPDGQLFRDGDDWMERNAFGYYWSFSEIAYAASYYKDPLLMGEAIRQSVISQSPLLDLLFIDPIAPVNYNFSALPLTKYFPYPFGGMTARTGWDKGTLADIAIADMKIVERHFAAHQHLDAGSFQIYYKGPLAVSTGVYQGTEGGYGCDHFTNYYQRTIAHNCMLVYNPAEQFTWYRRPISNDGGQRYPASAAEPANIDVVMTDEYKKGEVLAYDFGPDPVQPDYSYLKGDITHAYTGKVKNHQRTFVFLNLKNTQVPAVLIVYDYVVSSNKDFKKTWVMHCVPEPVFTDNCCTVTLKNDVKKYNGKLVNTVLLPLSQNIIWEKVGGPGNEYTVEGKNHPQQLQNEDNSNDNADWRIELSPKIPSETDVFLNVMQMTDADNTRLLPVDKIETERLTGVQIGDRIVLFAKNNHLENLPINLNMKGSGTFKVLITDLEKGNWEISGPKSPVIVRNDQNLIYFQALAGNYLITKK